MELSARVRVLALAAAAAAAACWRERPPRPPRMSSTPVPGTLWITPAQPWRASMQPTHLAAAGATALLGSGSWIARFDLGRGAVAHERWLDAFSIEQLLALPGGRWLAAGRRGARAAVATIDPATLAPTVVVTGAEGAEGGAYRRPARAVVLDEGIAIAGEGLPLAIYDPATWRVRRVVDPALGWSRPSGGGKALYALGDDGLVRFDLAAGTSAKVAASSYHDGTATHLVTRTIEKGHWVFTAEAAGAKARIGRGDMHVALDSARGRIALRDRAAIHVHALADGKRLASYELGESGHGHLYAMAFDGDRLVVSVAAAVRVIDLATGSITSPGDPPYGWGELSVSAAGEVQSLGAHAVRVTDGRVVASARVGLHDAAGDPRVAARYGVIRRPEARRVEVFEHGAPAPVGSWRMEDSVGDVWLGGAGGVAIVTDGVHAQRALFLASGGRLGRLTPIKFDALLHDVDVDAGHALVGVEGTAFLVRLRDATVLHELPVPGCERYASGELERGGDRLVVGDGPHVAVYRRSTGALIGAATIDEASDIIAFVPGRDELLLATRVAILLWDPRTGALRRRGGLAGLAEAEVSPDGRRVALSFHDGRIALADLDVLRASMTPGRAGAMEAAAVRADCPSGDPFELDPDHREDPDGGDDP